MKKILVVGSTGKVGNYLMKTLAAKYPETAIVGMSRNGRARDEETARISNVSYIRGDALDPYSFREHLEDVNSVVHCIQTLSAQIEQKN
jgi:nucleoside-diphosphate-sugar epimerase